MTKLLDGVSKLGRLRDHKEITPTPINSDRKKRIHRLWVPGLNTPDRYTCSCHSGGGL